MVQGIRESKAQLEDRVQNLKQVIRRMATPHCHSSLNAFQNESPVQELVEWRSRLDTRMQGHRDELGVLRESLRCEVKTLQEKFQQLKNNIKTQLEETTTIANKEGEIAAQWAVRDQ